MERKHSIYSLPHIPLAIMNGGEHIHYLCDGEEDTAVGPIVLTLESPLSQKEDRKAILRTKKGNERFIIPADQCANVKDMIKYLTTNVISYQPMYVRVTFPDLGKVKLTRVQDAELDKRLQEMEKKSITTKYKFGILYAKENQTDENEMFSNGKNLAGRISHIWTFHGCPNMISFSCAGKLSYYKWNIQRIMLNQSDALVQHNPLNVPFVYHGRNANIICSGGKPRLSRVPGFLRR